MARLTEKVVLITGAASGIGRATSILFAREGAVVVGTDVRQLREENQQAHHDSDAAFFQHDVTDETRWTEIMELTRERFGKLDILINCAGINGVRGGSAPTQAPDEVSLDTWREIFRVNVEGVLLGCRAAIPLLRTAQAGAIVNVSSIAAQRGWPVRSAYGASKAAILQYTKTVARYCAESGWNIRCNAVLPGPIDTPMLNPTSGPLTGGDGKAGADHVPMKRYGSAEEVAKPMLFLASDDASYITGVGLNVDGGIAATSG